jgi:hypothetical protein
VKEPGSLREPGSFSANLPLVFLCSYALMQLRNEAPLKDKDQAQ